MTSMTPSSAPRSYRTVWISDLHLGAKNCQADKLLEFLRVTEAQNFYLVGDIVDGWRLKRWWYWPQSHNDVVQKLLRKARKGARVIYIPGNHDSFARKYVGYLFGEIEVQQDAIHLTADGRKLLVLHGDEFDIVVRYAKWLALVGDRAYHLALWLNVGVNWGRRTLGLPHWSLSSFLKLKVKKAVQFIGAFETAVAQAARERGVDGVVCGHIHQPEMREVDGVLYCNDGDWMESCTALAEHHDGRLEILRWSEMAKTIESGAGRVRRSRRRGRPIFASSKKAEMG